MFCIDALLVDAGKTGYVTDTKRLQEIRVQHAKKYPDFLGKGESRSYQSKSIVGQLYRNARLYLDGKFEELERWFAQSIIDEPVRSILLFVWRRFLSSSHPLLHWVSLWPLPRRSIDRLNPIRVLPL
jgi:hypothetical protein